MRVRIDGGGDVVEWDWSCWSSFVVVLGFVERSLVSFLSGLWCLKGLNGVVVGWWVDGRENGRWK